MIAAWICDVLYATCAEDEVEVAREDEWVGPVEVVDSVEEEAVIQACLVKKQIKTP